MQSVIVVSCGGVEIHVFLHRGMQQVYVDTVHAFRSGKSLLKMCDLQTCHEPALSLSVVCACAVSAVSQALYIYIYIKCIYTKM